MYTHKLQPRQFAWLLKSFFLTASLIVLFSLDPARAHGAIRHFDLGGLVAPAGATFEQKTNSGSFLDIYSFEFLSSVPAKGTIGASLGAVGITDLMIGLWSNGSEIAPTQMFAATGTNFSAFDGLPSNSIYELRVSGVAGKDGGAYSGGFGLKAVVAPVPEPEVYAMMAIGIAVVGWAGRRKRKHQALASA